MYRAEKKLLYFFSNLFLVILISVQQLEFSDRFFMKSLSAEMVIMEPEEELQSEHPH